MITRIHIHYVLLLIVVSVVVFACVPQTPIAVYITPTPERLQSTATAVPTLEQLPSATSTETPSPLPPTASEGVAAEKLTPSATFMGAIVGPEYTLQPTDTPRPTRTPLVTETPVFTFTPSPPTGTPLPKLDRNRIGIQIDPQVSANDWGAAMYHAQQIGVGWVKLQANWSFLQPNGPQDYADAFKGWEWNVRNSKSRGFKVLISVAKAPEWARSILRESGPPDDPQLLGNFISFLLGKVGDAVDAIEIWNEPNLVREWTTTLPFSGAGYMRLFGPAYGAVRGYSSTMTIITAGLAPTGDSDGSIDDRVYLQQMYNAGLSNYQDVVVGIHPYSWGNSPDARCCNGVNGQGWDDNPRFFFSNNIQDYRNIMVKNGHANTQMWVTEFGWATWQGLPDSYPQGDDWMAYNDVWKQANYTIRALEIGQSLDYIGPMFLWNLNFANEFSMQGNEIAAYSLLIPGASPPERPLYWMLGQVTDP